MSELFCPSCGHLLNNDKEQVCPECQIKITPVRTKYNFEYYQELAEKRNPNCDFFDDAYNLMQEEIREYVKEHESIYRPIREKAYSEHPPKYYKEPIKMPQKNVPKCPVCQSTNIQKISAVKKAAHAYALGLFSKTARSQFECKSCGYKF